MHRVMIKEQYNDSSIYYELHIPTGQIFGIKYIA